MALQFQNYNFIGENFAIGGINLKSAVTNLKDNETPECKNVIFDNTGSVTKRSGFNKLNQTQITEAGVPQTITGIYQLNQSTGNSCVIIGAGTRLYETATDPMSNIIYTVQTSGAIYDFTALNDYAIIVNGADPDLKFNCTTVTDLGLTPPTAIMATATINSTTGTKVNGDYQYVYTFVDADGFESNPSPSVTHTIALVDSPADINVTNIADPTLAQIAAQNLVTKNLYRTTVNGAIFFQVNPAPISIGTTVFADIFSDAELGVEAEFDNDPPPVFKYIETHVNRLFGVEAAFPNRLRFSKQFNQQAWPALFFIDIDPDDGDMITGIKAFFDQLLIYKRETIYVLSGTDETNFSVQRAQTDARVGALSNRSIAIINNQSGFLSERAPYAFEGLRTAYIGENVEGIFDRNNPSQNRQFNWSQEAITCSINYRNKTRNFYWLNIPTGASLRNNLSLVYDYVLGNWTLFDGLEIHSIAIVEESNQPYVYTGDYNGFLWRQDETDNDGFEHFPSFSTSNTNTAFTLRDETQASVINTATGGAAFTLIDLEVSGTATSGAVNSLTDTLLVMTPNAFSGFFIEITAGTGVGQTREILSNTIDTFVVTLNWSITPDATSVYEVGPFNPGASSGSQVYIESGTGVGQFRTVASNTVTTLTVSVAWGIIPDATSVYIVGGWPVNALNGVRVKILSGLDAGDIRLIVSNTPVEFTISVAWSVIPDTTSEYSIGFIDAEWDSRWFHYNIPEFFKRLRYLHVNTDREGDYALDVGIRFDFFTGDVTSVIQELNLSGADSVWDVSLWDVAFWDQVSQVVTRLSNEGGHIHRYVQIVFSNDAGGEPFRVNSFNLLWQQKGIRGHI